MANKKKSVVEIMTDEIIEMLESGDLPPWRKGRTELSIANGVQVNWQGRAYKGVNQLRLTMISLMRGYQSNVWITRNHMKRIGSFMRKGERGTSVVYVRVYWVDADGKRVPAKEAKERDDLTSRYSLGMNYVWNVSQVGKEREGGSGIERVPDGRMKEIAERYISDGGPRLDHTDAIESAYYQPMLDVIHTYPVESMESEARYFGTLFHEIGHSTGHVKRMNREGFENIGERRLHEVAAEELVAEMFSFFMRGLLGVIPPDIGANTGAYIKSWLRFLENDRAALGKAANLAQEAVEYVLGKSGLKVDDFSLMSESDAEFVAPKEARPYDGERVGTVVVPAPPSVGVGVAAD